MELVQNSCAVEKIERIISTDEGAEMSVQLRTIATAYLTTVFFLIDPLAASAAVLIGY